MRVRYMTSIFSAANPFFIVTDREDVLTGLHCFASQEIYYTVMIELLPECLIQWCAEATCKGFSVFLVRPVFLVRAVWFEVPNALSSFRQFGLHRNVYVSAALRQLSLQNVSIKHRLRNIVREWGLRWIKQDSYESGWIKVE